MNHRTILFNSDVEDTIVEMVAVPLLNFQNDDSNEPVSLIINTRGGDVITSLFLIDIIDNYSKPLNIYVYGMAMSAGVYLLAAGNQNPNVKKYCYSFSYGLLHAGEIELQMGSSQAKDTMKFLTALSANIEKYLIEHTNLTDELYQQIKDREYYMSADEMKRLGFVDEIIGK